MFRLCKADLLDETDGGLAVVGNVARDVGNGVDRVAIVEVVIGIDFHLGVVADAGIAADMRDNLAAQRGKVAHRPVLINDAFQRSVRIRRQPHANGGHVYVKLLLLHLRGGGHLDVEISFDLANSQREHEKRQELKNDVDHRRHLLLNLVGHATAVLTNFHESPANQFSHGLNTVTG